MNALSDLSLFFSVMFQIQVVQERQTWGRIWGGKGVTHPWMKREADKEEKKRYKPANSAKEVLKYLLSEH